MADLYAERVLIEMPFAPASLYPARIETGGEELRARFRAGRAARIYSRVDHVVVHQTADPEVVIVEYDLHGELRPVGTPFVQYPNPITGARLLGRVPGLAAELTGAG